MARSLWVLIAAAGKPLLVSRTLRSLADCAKPPEYRGTIIVENGSRCGIEQVVHSFAREHGFRYSYVREANKSHALNCALAELGDGLVFMTDDDVRLDTQVLVAYCRAASNWEAGRFFGGPIEIDAEYGLPPEWMRRYYPLTIAEPWRLAPAHTTAVPGCTFMGTNWAAFAEDLAGIGGFDTRFGPGAATGATGQESDAQRRLMARGAIPVWVPEAIAWHFLHREFLDPSWVLKRTHRHGLEWGIRRTRDGQGIWSTIVRAALGRLNAHAKGAVLRAMGGEQRQFAAAFHESKWRGRWEGIQLGRRWNEVPQINAARAAQADKQAA